MFGVFVIEADGERAGVMRFSSRGGPNRIAELGGLAVHPDHRGRKLADEAARLFQRHLFDELGFHRLQLEVYGFNERAMRHAERSGFVLEGRKRRAYLRDGEWVDGVIYGLTVGRPAHASSSEPGGSLSSAMPAARACSRSVSARYSAGDLPSTRASMRQPTRPNTYGMSTSRPYPSRNARPQVS